MPRLISNSLSLLLAAHLHAADQPASPPTSLPTSVSNSTVTVTLTEFPGAINNPLKGFRNHKPSGFGLLVRQYIPWNAIELAQNDSTARIIAHTNSITTTSSGQPFEDLNIKLIPRVFLDWDGTQGTPEKPKQHWPADLHTFDYDSPAFQARLQSLIAKLGEAWDQDPRIFAVQMGLIGHFGEHHHPAPTPAQRQLLADAFQKAFKNKPVLVRHTDPEFITAGFGIYYDTFANITREPPDGPHDQFPWQATHVHPDIWKRAPIEGEVEYNWQQQRPDALPDQTFGRTPDETLTSPAFRRFITDKIRRYHASYLGWIDNYSPSNPDVLAGAADLQKAFGYRLVLDSVSYPAAAQPGATINLQLNAHNSGSAPFYLDWPVAVALLDPVSKSPVWSAPLSNIDIRQWSPGSDWDSSTFSYRLPASLTPQQGHATLPPDLKPGSYIIALAILDRQGGLLPSARFANTNYFRGGWHPLGLFGIGTPPPNPALPPTSFDNPAFDNSIHYSIPPHLRATSTPPPPPNLSPVTQWSPEPLTNLINPWRSWNLDASSPSPEIKILSDPADSARIIRLSGPSGPSASLNYSFTKPTHLPRGSYRFSFQARGASPKPISFDLADGWRKIASIKSFPLSPDWQSLHFDFPISSDFKEEPTLRFSLPPNASATFELKNPKLTHSPP